MVSLEQPIPFLIPACLKIVSREHSHLLVLGEVDVGRLRKEPALLAGLPEPSAQGASPLFSIRVPKEATVATCPYSGQRFHAAGPTAYEDDQPISDLAMLDGCHELGMLLALAAVTRACGALSLAAPEVGREALVQLAAFARVYETHAAKSGPRRPFNPLREDTEDDRPE